MPLLVAPQGRKCNIHWSKETVLLFSGLLPSFCFMETFCVCAGLLEALKKPIHPARLLFFLLLLSELKLPPGFQGSVMRRKRPCCSVTMLSRGRPGNVSLEFGQQTVVRLFYRRVPIPQRPHWAVVGFWRNFSGIPAFDQRSREPVEHSFVMF